ncbi:MAG: FAD binding domain-containing protein [Chloroflexi bacterium]|nr:FAD binding domain-containing protein [Chloroflexota bacterium]
MPVEPPVVSARTLPEAYELLAADALTPIAGGTDLMVRITGEIGEPPERLLDIGHLDALRGIGLTPGGHALSIGALATWTRIRHDPLARLHLGALAEAAATIGAAQIQNRGTLGGNVVNASPAGDSLPVLLAADSVFVLGSRPGERRVAAVDFWTGYRQTARRADELLLRAEVPLVDGRRVCFRKVGTRRAQAISKVVLAVAWRTAGDDPTWRDVRVAMGSIAAVPVRIPSVETLLEGSVPDGGLASRAGDALREAIAPIDDVRSTADHRRLVSGRILRRLIEDAV